MLVPLASRALGCRNVSCTQERLSSWEFSNANFTDVMDGLQEMVKNFASYFCGVKNLSKPDPSGWC